MAKNPHPKKQTKQLVVRARKRLRASGNKVKTGRPSVHEARDKGSKK